MKKRIFLLPLAAALVATGVAANAQATPQAGTVITTAPVAAALPDPNNLTQGILFPYWILDRAFQGHLNRSGEVDYSALKGDPYLDIFVKGVAVADVSQFPVLPLPPLPDDKDAKPRQSRAPEMVFWINAYNANVLKTVADAFPINNIGEIKDFDTAKTHRIAGQNYSFRELRQKIAGFDPRALFALTDGTKGGPLLAPAAYRLSGINDLLEIAVSNFVRDPRNVQVDRLKNTVYVNDFAKQANDAFAPDNKNDRKMTGVRNILAAYSDTRGGRNFLNTNDYKIELRSADRSINDGKVSAAPTASVDNSTSVNSANR